MKNHLPLLFILFIAKGHLLSQNHFRYQIPEAVYSAAYRVEVLKNRECTVISYTPPEYNETMTPRDDRDFGVQYFVSGKDCNHYFEETFKEFRGWDGENYAPLPTTSLGIDSYLSINTVTTDEIIADGCTKVFFTSFFLDNDPSIEVNKNIFLGTDVFIESADPASIQGPFDLSMISPETEGMSTLLEYLAKNDYYKLREMQVNKRLIVEKLRSDGALKDITPVVKSEKLKVKRFRIEN
jgi:hypothetical protein